jgi:hypothetical protein
MKISADSKKKLIDEIKFVLEKMKGEEDPSKKLYYFSAVPGIMNRIFNIEYAPDLIFAHFVLSTIQGQINARLHVPDTVIQIPKELYDKLFSATSEFLDVLEKNKNPYEVLKKFALLGYVTGGNGYYLYQKGLLKL